MSLNGPDHFKKHLFGTIPTDDGKNIKGSRLPTVKQTLLCYLANYDHGNTTHKEILQMQLLRRRSHSMSELVYVPFSQFHHYKGKRVQNIAGFVNEMSKTTNKFWPRGVLRR